MKSAKDNILKILKSAPVKDIKPRFDLSPPVELSFKQEELIARFTENISEQTGIVFRVRNLAEAREKLTEIAEQENLKTVMVSTDSVITQLNLCDWGKQNGIEILTAEDFTDRETYREAIFHKAQAGVTGVDYAIAESGTICLIHDKSQPRLISIAPILHIAVCFIERLLPVYETATDLVFDDKDQTPRHISFITGPSMTADIQGGQFKGMHGPGKLLVILIDRT